MADVSWRRPEMTVESHRVTAFEIFFDLVFVFAITRVVSFMTQSLTALALVQGLILLLLLWWSWTAYVWLGNRVRADRGLVRAGMLVVMASLFVAALVMPDAWSRGTGTLDAPLILALTFTIVRVVYFGLHLSSAVDDRKLRAQLMVDAIPQSLAQIVLIIGAALTGSWQTALWATAFAVDFGGGRIASGLGGWKVRSPGHFAERYRMVLIIVLGESLISAGTGGGNSVTRASVLFAALLGFVAVVCLWLLYFADVAGAAENVLERASEVRRAQIARDAYTMVHFLLIAGVIYVALGIREVLSDMSGGDASNGGVPLSWPATTALYGGAAVYLLGRAAFSRLTVRSVPAAQLVAAGALLVLIPVARHLPALAALGTVSAALVALVAFEWRATDRGLGGTGEYSQSPDQSEAEAA